MTFTEIVDSVKDRLNLTSTEANTRIGKSVNERYRWLVTTLNLDTSVRAVKTASCVIGNQFVTFTATLKPLSVYDATVSPPRVLDERTVDELRNGVVRSGKAQLYAVYRIGANTVQLMLDSLPTAADVLSADVVEQTATLSGSTAPAFSENFHDILEVGAMATELKKMEKPALADECEQTFQMRLSELRLFIAKSAYLDLYTGKTAQQQTWRTRSQLL